MKKNFRQNQLNGLYHRNPLPFGLTDDLFFRAKNGVSRHDYNLKYIIISKKKEGRIFNSLVRNVGLKELEKRDDLCASLRSLHKIKILERSKSLSWGVSNLRNPVGKI